ncbi:hypothetical protein [Paenibacillus sp. NEAU-GSW1]|uniref:hypothetical protein n=1 Tax=Paenibacillus sp. NEAU-GSW1 TaxID=2682486 RepID=UPI0012E2D199|nr:hypothetical protein [Paenibacillus sp. NEAU-GSW1]MUT68063.1 hypothetical protein [Paenibacillus sp. NEAU-GSW1]
MFVRFVEEKGASGMKLQLAVAMKEQEYARRLADYVRASPFGNKWQLTAFTNPEAFVHFLKGGYPLDLIAAQPEMLEAAGSSLPPLPIAALIGGNGTAQTSTYTELQQYQPLPELLAGLSSIYAAYGKIASPIQGENGASVITVYSASGGVGKTSLSLQLLNAAASNGYRGFYLNLERWNAMDVWLEEHPGSQEGEGLSQLLYLLKTQPDRAGSWLQLHRKRHRSFKGDYLLPFSNLEDRMSLQAGDAESIVKAIASSGQYDLIIVDLDEAMDELHLALYERSDQVVWLLTDDPSVKRKSELAYLYGGQRWESRFRAAERRFQFVVNKRSGSDGERQPQAQRVGARPIAAALPDVAGAGGGAFPSSIIAHPQYKAAVERLFRQLMKEGGDKQVVNR